MNILILFTSNCGSTKTYAEDLSKTLNADVFPLKGYKLKKMKDYDTIIYMGWVRGGEIMGLNKFLTEWDLISEKNVIVCSVGMSMPSADGRRILINQNLLDLYHIRYYQMRGSFDFTKLKFPNSFLISQSIKRMSQTGEAIEKPYLARIKEEPIIVYDREKMDRVIEVVRSLEKESDK